MTNEARRPKAWQVVVGLIMLTDGITLGILSLTADYLGAGPGYGFGQKQVWGLGVGVFLSIAGAVILGRALLPSAIHRHRQKLRPQDQNPNR